MNSDILATTLKGLHIFLSHCVCGLALCCVRFLDAGGVGSPPVQLQHRSQAHIHTNITDCSRFFYNFPAIKTGVLLFCCCCWLVICLPDCLTAWLPVCSPIERCTPLRFSFITNSARYRRVALNRGLCVCLPVCLSLSLAIAVYVFVCMRVYIFSHIRCIHTYKHTYVCSCCAFIFWAFQFRLIFWFLVFFFWRFLAFF